MSVPESFRMKCMLRYVERLCFLWKLITEQVPALSVLMKPIYLSRAGCVLVKNKLKPTWKYAETPLFKELKKLLLKEKTVCFLSGTGEHWSCTQWIFNCGTGSFPKIPWWSQKYELNYLQAINSPTKRAEQQWRHSGRRQSDRARRPTLREQCAKPGIIIISRVL